MTIKKQKRKFILFLRVCNTFPMQLSAARTVNELRAMHSAPLLVWSEEVRRIAQAHADKGVFQHSRDRRVGENLALVCAADANTAVQRAIQLWYDEVKLYNWRAPGFEFNTGHFTALVWKATTKMGVGVKEVSPKKFLVVANFTPPGNVLGQFPANVLPRKR
jgi:glioma pathogenesis-related protein 2